MRLAINGHRQRRLEAAIPVEKRRQVRGCECQRVDGRIAEDALEQEDEDVEPDDGQVREGRPAGRLLARDREKCHEICSFDEDCADDRWSQTAARRGSSIPCCSRSDYFFASGCAVPACPLSVDFCLARAGFRALAASASRWPAIASALPSASSRTAAPAVACARR